MAKKDKSILLIIYKIEDNIGSEDGCGFEIALRAIQEYKQVTIISRPNNIALLEEDLRFKDVNLISVEVPKAIGWFKKKERGIILYYYLWQVFVGRYIAKVKQKYNIIHLVNFHTDWCPHFIPQNKGKIIWGPVIHHSNTPKDFIFAKNKLQRCKFLAKEYLRRVGKFYFWRLDPFMKPAIKRTDHVIYGNANYAPPFKKFAKKITAFPYGGSIFNGKGQKDLSKEFRCLFVGRLINLKGAVTALDAFADFIDNNKANAQLDYVGSGDLKELLQARATELGIADKVNFIAKIPQQELIEYYDKAHLFLFPSFESQGLVVSEAMSFGTPVLCIEGHGPSFISDKTGVSVKQQNYKKVVSSLSVELNNIYGLFIKKEPYNKMLLATHKHYKKHLNWDAIYKKISDIYNEQS